MILGIDPGPSTSAAVYLHGSAIEGKEYPNADLLKSDTDCPQPTIVIEEFTPHGNPFDRDARETCRFIDTMAATHAARGTQVVLTNRDTVLAHFGCKTPQWNPKTEKYATNDTKLRRALIERIGKDALKGFSGSHLYSALAVALWYQDTVGGMP